MGQLDDKVTSNLIGIVNNPMVFDVLDKETQNELLGVLATYVKTTLNNQKAQKQTLSAYNEEAPNLNEEDITNLIAIANNSMVFGVLDKETQKELLVVLATYVKTTLNNQKAQEQALSAYNEETPYLNKENITNLIALAINPMVFGVLDKETQKELLGVLATYVKTTLNNQKAQEQALSAYNSESLGGMSRTSGR